uniref:Uncharacterized protein n=1 Tax=Anguilla anguilla TaxID=7936 RepID=A0A0E9TKU7_ANGAN
MDTGAPEAQVPQPEVQVW